MLLEQNRSKGAATQEAPVLIRLLGGFALLRAGQIVSVPSGGKLEALLGTLALHYHNRVPRELLLSQIWPNQEPGLASQSLNSLVYSLRKQLADQLDGAPIVHEDGYYRLNLVAGIQVDLAQFEALLQQAERALEQGRQQQAIDCYLEASQLYRGDIWGGNDAYAAVERERLRASYLMLLSRLAEYWYGQQQYDLCLSYARRLLASDPCREDAHRMLMLCYLRRGERAQALRQFQLCANILRSEFDTTPEQATLALYHQIRTTPESLV